MGHNRSYFNLFVLIILCLPTFVMAQQADLVTIRNSIEAKFSVELDTVDLCEIVILNGTVFSQTDINNELIKYATDQIRIMQLTNISASTLYHQNCKFVMLLGTGENQTKEEKKKLLSLIRNNLNEHVPNLIIHDYTCEACKQLVVDGAPVEMYRAKEFLNEVKLKHIQYIGMYDAPDPAVYGRNAKNGMVEIFTRK
jgi:hypothetical protein